MSNHYEVPSWAGKSAAGLHLDVLKETKLFQKLMIDQKKCFLFGRNPQLVDFCIDHQSCSRVHAALVYHKALNRAFLVDLGSTHGTYIGSVRLESEKPTQLPIDSQFHFGASTRIYILRERPQTTGSRPIMEELEKSAADSEQGGLLGLPETETELDNLTEFNTAHNRRISSMSMGIAPDEDGGNKFMAKKRRRTRITFNEDEDVINPEDVDPNVGRFRNLVETSIVPSKRSKMHLGLMGSGVDDHSALSSTKRHTHQSLTPPTKGLYEAMYDVPGSTGPGGPTGYSGLFGYSLSSKLGLPLPNPAPAIDMAPEPMPLAAAVMPPPPAAMGPPYAMDSGGGLHGFEEPDEPKKKKYAKEAWPGKKPTPSLLV